MLKSKNIVLVNEQDEVLGTAEKLTAHNANTPLHRGVSVFLFNTRRQLLIQKRHSNKKTWGNFWSNSFCGHPQIDETYEQAVVRHGEFELSVKLNKVFYICNYRYKFTHNDIVENEICPIYLAISDQFVIPNFQEISQIEWLKWSDFLNQISINPSKFTPWCSEEALLLKESKILQEYLDI